MSSEIAAWHFFLLLLLKVMRLQWSEERGTKLVTASTLLLVFFISLCTIFAARGRNWWATFWVLENGDSKQVIQPSRCLLLLIALHPDNSVLVGRPSRLIQWSAKLIYLPCFTSSRLPVVMQPEAGYIFSMRKFSEKERNRWVNGKLGWNMSRDV